MNVVLCGHHSSFVWKDQLRKLLVGNKKINVVELDNLHKQQNNSSNYFIYYLSPTMIGYETVIKLAQDSVIHNRAMGFVISYSENISGTTYEFDDLTTECLKTNSHFLSSYGAKEFKDLKELSEYILATAENL